MTTGKNICVLQSHAPGKLSPWLQSCLASVQHWAEQAGFQYRCVGDELFNEVPGWYLEKVADRTPILADLGRLQWMRKLLSEGCDQVVWFDADTLIFAPDQFHLPTGFLASADECTPSGHQCAVFGLEHWLQEKNGKLRVYRNVHNAYMGFRVGSPVLPFLIYAVEQMMRRVDEAFIAPQFVGPKLLTNLHNTVGFNVDSAIGAISPELCRALLEDDQAALQVLRGAMEQPLYGANLSQSVISEGHMPGLIDKLQSFKNGLK